MTRTPRLPFLFPWVLVAACGAETLDDTATDLGYAVDEKNHGGITEACDGVDNNADGIIDEDCGECDFLTTRGTEFWSHNPCTVTGGALGFPLLPLTVGGTTYTTYPDLQSFLQRPSSTLLNLALGQELAAAKLNVAAFNLGQTLYIDANTDGSVDTVSVLVDAAELAYLGTSVSKKTTFHTLLSTFNAIGTSLPLYFDPTCTTPPEICDGLDNDGDGTTDENCGCVEVCDGLDNDDNAHVDDGARDADGDGYGCDDCNDANANVHPGATELANGVDDDCNGGIDETVDVDGDGYSLVAGDCNNNDAAIHPGIAEICNGIDDDCNHQVDEGLTSVWYQDGDGDGQGRADLLIHACSAPAGYVASVGDCDDTNPLVSIGATETCDGLDNDCDGSIDDGLALQTWYTDADGDGYGAGGSPVTTCLTLFGFATNNTDCNDTNVAAFPSAPEACDGVDNNCDGAVDEGTSAVWYLDADGDGEGGTSTSVTECAAPSGFVGSTGDCNDGNAAIHHGVAESCNGVDDNCDGIADEGVSATYYRDADGDGRGSSTVSVSACSQPGGYVTNTADCNDGNAAVFTGAAEVCNGVDDNCSGAVDEGVAYLYFLDADADGYGTSSSTTRACGVPSGYATNPADCNDANASANPAMREVCNGADDNCNGVADDGINHTYYRDADGDTYGDPAVPTAACAAPGGYVDDKTDCNDMSGGVHPGEVEIPDDGTDQNCDGSDAT